MNKILLLLVLGASFTFPAWADPAPAPNNSAPAAPAPPPPGGGRMMGGGGITPEDGQELMEAHNAALQANPDLVAEGKALQVKLQAYQKKIEAAMIKVDPNVAPILAEIDAERQQQQQQRGGPGGPPPPPPSSSTPPPAPSGKSTGN